MNSKLITGRTGCRLSQFGSLSLPLPCRSQAEAASHNLSWLVIGVSQWSTRRDIWGAAWDPQVWPSDQARGSERVPDDVGTVQDGLALGGAAVPAAQGVQEEEDPSGSAPIAVAVAPLMKAPVLLPTPTEFADIVVQTDIRCSKQGHPVPRVQKPTCETQPAHLSAGALAFEISPNPSTTPSSCNAKCS